ncbi:MAG: DUF2911 domain-containing protein [Gemmatimonadales bacterium]|nr:MAG: DUF2911 domain-containing protein [Gemmatimonadales bacterium]
MSSPTALILALLTALPAVASSQAIAFSQHGSVTQTVAFTELSIEYNRPVARGRELFGTLVPWNKVWHPGADSASSISFSKDVLLEGRSVAAGRYSLWIIPRPRGVWTVILSRAADVFHTPYPGEEHDAYRFEVAPEKGDHMETLAWYFPEVSWDTAVLRFHWGEVMLGLRIKAPAK